MDKHIRVEVVYALSDQQFIRQLRLETGVTAKEAVAASGLVVECPEIDLSRLDVGVWGRKVAPDHQVCDGDRVEIYRTLQADPKETRRRRAARKALK